MPSYKALAERLTTTEGVENWSHRHNTDVQMCRLVARAVRIAIALKAEQMRPKSQRQATAADLMRLLVNAGKEDGKVEQARRDTHLAAEQAARAALQKRFDEGYVP